MNIPSTSKPTTDAQHAASWQAAKVWLTRAKSFCFYLVLAAVMYHFGLACETHYMGHGPFETARVISTRESAAYIANVALLLVVVDEKSEPTGEDGIGLPWSGLRHARISLFAGLYHLALAIHTLLLSAVLIPVFRLLIHVLGRVTVNALGWIALPLWALGAFLYGVVFVLGVLFDRTYQRRLSLLRPALFDAQRARREDNDILSHLFLAWYRSDSGVCWLLGLLGLTTPGFVVAAPPPILCFLVYRTLLLFRLLRRTVRLLALAMARTVTITVTLILTTLFSPFLALWTAVSPPLLPVMEIGSLVCQAIARDLRPRWIAARDFLPNQIDHCRFVYRQTCREISFGLVDAPHQARLRILRSEQPDAAGPAAARF